MSDDVIERSPRSTASTPCTDVLVERSFFLVWESCLSVPSKEWPSREIEAALQEHRIDLGLVEGVFRLPNLKYTTFLEDELVAVVHSKSRLQLPEEITPQDLLAIPLVLRERGSGTLDVIERSLQKHGVKLSSLHVLMYLGSTESIKLFLENSDCMGIVSIRSICKELAAGTFRVVEIKDMPMLRDFCFVQLQGQEGGLSQAFMNYMFMSR